MSPAPAVRQVLAGLNPAARVRERFRRWWQSRLPLSDVLVLTQRNVYILPTRPGFVFAATLVVLLIASINYQLNLGYLLTFLLAGAGVAGMHITHATLRGLTLRLKPPPPVFAGEAALLEVTLTGEDRRPPPTRPSRSTAGTAYAVWTVGTVILGIVLSREAHRRTPAGLDRADRGRHPRLEPVTP